MFRDLRTGASGFTGALPFAFRHGMGWMFMIPALLWLLFFLLLSGSLDQWTSTLATRLLEWIGLQGPANAQQADAASNVGEIARATGAWLIRAVVKLGFWVLFLLVSKYLALILLSPLLAYASEKTEAILTGRDFPFDLRQFLRDVLRGALIALRNGVIEVSIALALWLLSLFVPILSPFTFIAALLASAYFTGYSLFDYVFERHRLRMRHTIATARAHRALLIGTGLPMILLMSVPLVGLVFGPLMGAIGASMAWHRKNGGRDPSPGPAI